MKLCPRCEITTDDFTRTDLWCRPCRREYNRINYQKNRGYWKQRTDAQKAELQRLRALVAEAGLA